MKNILKIIFILLNVSELIKVSFTFTEYGAVVRTCMFLRQLTLNVLVIDVSALIEKIDANYMEYIFKCDNKISCNFFARQYFMYFAEIKSQTKQNLPFILQLNIFLI